VGRDAEIEGTPHEPRRGWLKNGNPPGDLSPVRRCGRRIGAELPASAQRWQMERCRLHGGLSTGPKSLARYLAHSARGYEAWAIFIGRGG
jgi:hypothetical protein